MCLAQGPQGSDAGEIIIIYDNGLNTLTNTNTQRKTKICIYTNILVATSENLTPGRCFFCVSFLFSIFAVLSCLFVAALWLPVGKASWFLLCVKFCVI